MRGTNAKNVTKLSSCVMSGNQNYFFSAAHLSLNPRDYPVFFFFKRQINYDKVS